MTGGRIGASTEPRQPDKRGRPSSLTADTLAAIEKRIKGGSSYADAATLAGIAPRTFQQWMAKGRDDADAGKASDYLHFFQRVSAANLIIKQQLISRVIAGSRNDPRLALKILERRFPEEWGLKIKIDDSAPERPTSPRERFLQRLAAIEDRHQRAEAAVRQVLRVDAPDLAEGANGANGERTE